MDFSLISKNLGKIVLILTMISFAWFGTFGLFYHVMEMGSDQMMDDGCLFNGQVEMCTMNFSEHLALWRETITSLPQSVGLWSTLILAIISAVMVVLWRYSLFDFFKRAVSRWKLYLRKYPHLLLFNYLREIFSRGILNSKIYETVTL